VGRGDRWSGGKLKVMVGHRFFFNNDFALASEHHLREFRLIDGRLVAVIDFSYDGRFDSDEHPDRFTDDWRSQGRVIHEVDGSGTAYYDVDGGCLVWKSDSATVVITREFQTTRTEKAGSAKKIITGTETVVDRYDARITQRLMSPSDRLPGTAAGR
jgi:hypothetical protein